ncbi:MAG: ribonuclease H family protein [Eubacteriales bacterium]|nr:ribonuclease H family protein [Eubacteriales bacterium]
MAKKYYAVRKGRQTGVFEAWDECRRQVLGYAGAEYKSFITREEAERFVSGKKNNARKVLTQDAAAVQTTSALDGGIEAYVDGSYLQETGEFSYGMIILQNGREYCFSQKIEDRELASMHNVAGEIKGAEAAMRYALENGIKRLTIYHDYEGIAKWCTGQWKANKAGTQSYRDFYQAIKDKVQIKFVKVRGHSDNKYNDIADELAKAALGIKSRK